jgi:hypothetical protein
MAWANGINRKIQIPGQFMQINQTEHLFPECRVYKKGCSFFVISGINGVNNAGRKPEAGKTKKF